MGAEQLLASKASEAIEALYSSKVDAASLQIAATRKDFEETTLW